MTAPAVKWLQLEVYWSPVTRASFADSPRQLAVASATAIAANFASVGGLWIG